MNQPKLSKAQQRVLDSLYGGGRPWTTLAEESSEATVEALETKGMVSTSKRGIATLSPAGRERAETRRQRQPWRIA